MSVEWARGGLSLTMMRALRAVREREGLPGNEYPGRWRTIDALRRRRLIEVRKYDHQEGPAHHVFLTDAGRDVHLHEFTMTLHMDGCHYYSTAARCACGATYTHYGERDLKADPYSAIWMAPEDPEAAACPRCEELMNGARPVFREAVQEPKAKAAA